MMPILAVPDPAPRPEEPPAVVESVQETPATNMPKFQRRRSSYSSQSETEDPKPMRKMSVSSSTSSREQISKINYLSYKVDILIM